MKYPSWVSPTEEPMYGFIGCYKHGSKYIPFVDLFNSVGQAKARGSGLVIFVCEEENVLCYKEG